MKPEVTDSVVDLDDSLSPFPAMDMPMRSVLPSLPLLGCGAEHVESVGSYLNRVSLMLKANRTSLLRNLVERAGLPDDLKFRNPTDRYNLCQQLRVPSGSINGLGLLSMRVAYVIGKATGNQNVKQGTLVDFASILPNCHQMRNISGWCKECLSSDLKEGRVLYQRLLWSMRDYRVCHIHGCGLSYGCRCGWRGSMKALERWTGRCPQCRKSLGHASVESVVDDSEFALFCSKEIAEVIGHRSLIDGKPSLAIERLRNNVRLLRSMCRTHRDFDLLTGVRGTSAKSWYQGEHLPELARLLRVSKAFSVPVWKLLFVSLDSATLSRTAVASGTVGVTCKQAGGSITVLPCFRSFDVCGLESLLDSCLKSEVVVSPTEVAAQAGWSVAYLEKRLPMQMATIRSRWLKHVTELNANVRKKIQEDVYAACEIVRRRGLRVTEREVVRCMPALLGRSRPPITYWIRRWYLGRAGRSQR